MLDVPKIRAILDEASRWDMDYEAFGTEGHLHLLRPVFPLEELEAWEELMGLTLPEDYRIYLTQLGNGGAGPAYGLQPFTAPLDGALCRPCVYSEDREEAFLEMVRRFIRMYETDDDWTLYLDYFPDTPAWKDRQWQEAHWKEWTDQLEQLMDRDIEDPMLHNGQMLIANEGCAADIYLILNGSHRGFCHCCTMECDPDIAFPKPHSFAAYHDWALGRDFTAYYMEYVDRTEDLCQNMSAEKRTRARWERAQVRDFLAAVQAADWQGARLLLKAVGDSQALSKKARSFYAHYETSMIETFPEDTQVKRFFDGISSRRNRRGKLLSFYEPDGIPWFNPRFPFKDFVRTFED